MNEQERTILYGLKLERDLLRDKIKKAERKYNRARGMDNEIKYDCERLDLIKKQNEIIESIERIENSIKPGCGKEIPAGFDKDRGYPLHDTCGFMDNICKDCSAKSGGTKK